MLNMTTVTLSEYTATIFDVVLLTGIQIAPKSNQVLSFATKFFFYIN